MQRSWPDIGAFFLLLVLVAFFFWRLWIPDAQDQIRFPDGDFTEQYYPLRRFVAASLAEGRFPFWNPYIFGGQPGFADPQAAVLYPPALLNALWHGAEFPLDALEFEAVAHIALAAWGTYFFVRLVLGLGITPALVGAIIFAFGGYLTGFPLQQITILETLAWLPWLLLTIHKTALTPHPPLPIIGEGEFFLPSPIIGRGAGGEGHLGRACVSSALASLIFACALLAGHPQSAVYLAYLSGFYALFLFVRIGWQQYQATTPNVGRLRHLTIKWVLNGFLLFAPFLLGLLLAYVQLQATLDFIDEASRRAPDYNFVQNGLRWFELNEVLLPKIVGGTPLYVGVLSLLLAPLGLISAGQRPEKYFWGVAALLSLILAVGGKSILFDLLYLGLPYLDNVRNQERVLIIWTWSMALLSAWGVATLLASVQTQAMWHRLRSYVRWVANFIPILLFPLLVLWWIRAIKFSQIDINLEVFASFFDSYSFAFVIFLLGWGILAWYSTTVSAANLSETTPKPPPSWKKAAFAILLVCLLLFDLFSITRATHLGERADQPVVAHNEVIEALQALPDSAPLRIGVVGKPTPRGNDGMYWQLPLLTGNEPLRLAKTKRFIETINSWRQVQLLGIQYIVADRDLASEEPNAFELVAQSSIGRESYLLRIRPQMPYAWTVKRVKTRSNLNSLYHRVNQNDFEPYELAFIEEKKANIDELENEAPVANVTLLEHGIGHATVQVQNSAHREVLLIFAEPHSKGWQLFLDEQPIRTIRANALNVSTFIPPGEYIVRLQYEQPGWQEGLLVSGSSLFVIVLMLSGGLWSWGREVRKAKQ